MSKLKEIATLLKQSVNKEQTEVIYTAAAPLSQTDFTEISEVFGKDTIVVQKSNSQMGAGFKLSFGGLELDSTLHAQAADFSKQAKDTDDAIEKIKQLLEEYNPKHQIQEIGQVISVKDGVCYATGLTHCQSQELLYFPEKEVYGIALSLDIDSVGIIVLEQAAKLEIGDKVERTMEIAKVSVGEELLGRVINPLAKALDGKPEPKSTKSYPIEKVAPGVITREEVNKPLKTGITAIDALVPIGRGQRELILGDRQTGKTAIAIDTIINQKEENVICIYVSIGQKASKLSRIVETLTSHDAMEYTIVVAATAADSASLQYIAPYAATAMAEYFCDQGKDVLIIYDDLTKHAVAYRELSLLLRRPPGREAYPGDVFYLHSRLLERACNLSNEFGGGSITALPIIETQAGDISAYIPTNVISITDGQIYLETDLFYKGVRPAINAGLSVSRVGSAAQTKPMKKVAGSTKLTLAQFRELEAFSQFASDLDATTKEQLEKGKRITELLKQNIQEPLSDLDQVLNMFAVNHNVFQKVEVALVNKKATEWRDYVKANAASVCENIKQGTWDNEVESKLKELAEQFRDA